MATVAESLFGVTPESLQQQRQEALLNRGVQLAQLDPFQQAYASIYAGAGNIGRGVGGLLGAEDPELMRVRQRQQLLQGINPADPASLRAAAQRAIEFKDFQAAQEFASRALAAEKTQSEIAKNLRERAAADPYQQFLRSAIGKVTPESLAKYRETNDPADLEWTDKGAKGAATTELGKLLQERSQLDPIKDKESYDAYNAKIKKLTTGGGIGSEIAAGLSPIMGVIAKGQAQKSGETGGAAVGKETAAIQGKYTALSSIKDALDVVERGIYAGGYGPMEEALAKYGAGVVGNKNRLVNTEEFRAYIGDVVIPRLQEFGGNDSVEELKYLRSVMAGETSLEKASIERILKNADKKIRAGIQRLEAQQKAIVKGEQLPVGPLGGKQFTTKSGVVYTKE